MTSDERTLVIIPTYDERETCRRLRHGCFVALMIVRARRVEPPAFG